MKTADEIRKYRDALVRNNPNCNCGELKCYLSGVMMNDTIQTLSWILDDMDVDQAILFEARVRRLFNGEFTPRVPTTPTATPSE